MVVGVLVPPPTTELLVLNIFLRLVSNSVTSFNIFLLSSIIILILLRRIVIEISTSLKVFSRRSACFNCSMYSDSFSKSCVHQHN